MRRRRARRPADRLSGGLPGRAHGRARRRGSVAVGEVDRPAIGRRVAVRPAVAVAVAVSLPVPVGAGRRVAPRGAAQGGGRVGAAAHLHPGRHHPVRFVGVAAPGGADPAAARDARGGLALDHDAGVARPLLLHQPEQGGGLAGREADAAVRGRAPERREVGGAVDGVAGAGEEDGVGHRRVVPFPREMGAGHALRPVAAVRRVVPGLARRDRPGEARLPVHADRHGLRVLVDPDQHVRPRGAEGEAEGKGAEEGGAAAHGGLGDGRSGTVAH